MTNTDLQVEAAAAHIRTKTPNAQTLTDRGSWLQSSEKPGSMHE